MAAVRGSAQALRESRTPELGVWMEGRPGKKGRVAHFWLASPGEYAVAFCGYQAYRPGLEPAEPGSHRCVACSRLMGVEEESVEPRFARGGR